MSADIFFGINIFKQLMLIASCANHGLSIYCSMPNGGLGRNNLGLFFKSNFNKTSGNIPAIKSSLI